MNPWGRWRQQRSRNTSLNNKKDYLHLRFNNAILQCNFTVWFYSVISQCDFTVWFHSVISQCDFTVQFHSVISQCDFTVRFHSVISQCDFTVWFDNAISQWDFTMRFHSAILLSPHCRLQKMQQILIVQTNAYLGASVSSSTVKTHCKIAHINGP